MRFSPRHILRLFSVFAASALFLDSGTASQSRLDIKPDSRIVILGNTLAEQMATHGYFEAALHCAFPEERLVVRNMGFSGDQISDMTRDPGFGDLDTHLTRVGADVIFAFFGFNESFAGSAGIEKFRSDLAAFIEARLTQRYNGESPPQLVMVSPVPYRQTRPEHPGDLSINANLRLYRDVMREVCLEQGIRFLDVFTALEARSTNARRAFTDNGIHLNAFGHWVLSKILAEKLELIEESPEADFWGAEAVRRLVNKKNLHWLNRWRPVNGQLLRDSQSAVVAERLDQMERMIDLAEKTIWHIEKPGILSVWAMEPGTSSTYLLPPGPVAGAKTPPPQSETFRPEEVLQGFELAPGFEIRLWASEKLAPFANPTAMHFDGQGRLWILCSPSPPTPTPGALPDDYLMILEDQDFDHRADKHTIFARGLAYPTGFGLSRDGAYVAERSSIVHFRDRDHNGVADQRQLILTGFGTGNLKHGLAAFEWGPDGSLWFSQGSDLVSRIESPWGPETFTGSSLFRFSPSGDRLQRVSGLPFESCHGQVFDSWGRGLLADASTGNTISFSQALSPGVREPDGILPEPNSQPISGIELLASRHFPKAMRNSLISSQIGAFPEVHWCDFVHQETALKTRPRSTPFLSSRNPQFQPRAVEIGPDGALYLLDSGQAAEGDANLTLTGRVWRIAAQGKREFWRRAVRSEPVEVLLEQLRAEEPGTRQQVRRELWQRNPDAVLPIGNLWIQTIELSDPHRAQLLTEFLRLHQAYGKVNGSLLEAITESPDAMARATTARVLGDWHESIDNELELLARLMEDEDPRVRFASMLAANQIGTPQAGDVVTLARHWPMDEFLKRVYESTRERLGSSSGPPPSLRARAIATSNADLVSGEMTHHTASVLLERKIYEKEHQVGLHRAAIVLARRQSQSLSEYFISRMSDPETPDQVLENIQTLLTKADLWELHFARETLLQIATQSSNEKARQTAYAALVLGACTSRSEDRLVEMLNERGDFPITEMLLASATVADQSSVQYRIKNLVRDELAVLNPPATRAARYVRILSPQSHEFRFTELEVISKGANLAKGKPTRQISGVGAVNWWEQTAAAGTNGITKIEQEEPVNLGIPEEKPVMGVAIGASSEQDLWWEVDLEAMTEIGKLVLHPSLTPFHSTILHFQLRDERGEIVYQTSRPASSQPIEVDVQLAPERIAAASVVARKLGDDFKSSLVTVGKYAAKMSDRFAAMRALSRIGGAPSELKITMVNLEAKAADSPSFHPAFFTVDPRTPVELTFKNSGTSALYFLVLEPESEEEIEQLLQSKGFTCESLRSASPVLQATSLIANGHSNQLQFLAPTVPGSYPLLCFIPGTGETARGSLTVKAPPPPPPAEAAAN